MFYDLMILGSQNNGRFKIAWIAATRGVKYLTSKQVKETNICKLCDEVMTYLTSGANTPRHRFSLRLTAMLTDGILKIHQRQIIQFQNELFVIMTTYTTPMFIDMPVALLDVTGQFQTPPTPVTRVRRTKKQREELAALQRQQERERGREQEQQRMVEAALSTDELQVLGNLEEALAGGMARLDDITLREEIVTQQPFNREDFETFGEEIGQQILPAGMQPRSELQFPEIFEQPDTIPGQPSTVLQLTELVPRVEKTTPQAPAKKKKNYPWDSSDSSCEGSQGQGPIVLKVRADVHATKDGPETSAVASTTRDPMVEQEQEVLAQMQVPEQVQIPEQVQMPVQTTQDDISIAAQALPEVAQLPAVRSDLVQPETPESETTPTAAQPASEVAQKRKQVVQVKDLPSIISKFRLKLQLSRSRYIDRFPETALQIYKPPLPPMIREQSIHYQLQPLWDSYPTSRAPRQKSSMAQAEESSLDKNFSRLPVAEHTASKDTIPLPGTPLFVDLGVHSITNIPAGRKTSIARTGQKLPLAASTPVLPDSMLPTLQHTIIQDIAAPGNGEPLHKRRRFKIDDEPNQVVAQKDVEEFEALAADQIQSILATLQVEEQVQEGTTTGIVPIGQEIRPEIVGIIASEEQAVADLVQENRRLGRAQTEATNNGDDRDINIRRRNMVKCITKWNNDRPIEITDVCLKPVTRMHIARAFQDLLVLKTQGKVKLIKEYNSLELKSIEKGPKLV